MNPSQNGVLDFTRIFRKTTNSQHKCSTCSGRKEVKPVNTSLTHRAASYAAHPGPRCLVCAAARATDLVARTMT